MYKRRAGRSGSRGVTSDLVTSRSSMVAGVASERIAAAREPSKRRTIGARAGALTAVTTATGGVSSTRGAGGSNAKRTTRQARSARVSRTNVCRRGGTSLK